MKNEKLFLATTADQRYWKKDEKLLFLGEWCKEYKDNGLSSIGSYETLDYHWKDCSKFDDDNKFLDYVYEKYLKLLTLELNKVHEVNYSEGYWRIILGLWLREFIDVLYDRYLSLKNAEKKAITNTWICPLDSKAPEKSQNYGDEYNLYLYSFIIKNFTNIPYEIKCLNCTNKNKKEDKSSVKNKIKKISNFIINPTRVFNYLTRYFITKIYPLIFRIYSLPVVFAGYMYLGTKDIYRLHLAIKQPPFIYHGLEFILRHNNPDERLRSAIIFPSSENEFERLLNEIIPIQIPLIYVENYHEMNKKTLIISPSKPKIIISAYSVHFRECFHFWAAYNKEMQGAKIFIIQHGGGFGSARHMFFDEHILAAFDRYYTWGATFDGNKKAKAMPSFRLYASKKKLSKSKNNGDIMWARPRYPRYRTNLHSGISAPYMDINIQEQILFIDSLNEEVRALLVARYCYDSENEIHEMKRLYPWLKMQSCEKVFYRYSMNTDFYEKLMKSRLVVFSCNETGYLETLASNFPTIIYWNPLYYEIKDELSPYFNELISVGIFHHSANSAAEMINSIYRNPLAWWLNDKTQKAVKRFCKALAYTDEKCIEIWKKELVLCEKTTIEKIA